MYSRNLHVGEMYKISKIADAPRLSRYYWNFIGSNPQMCEVVSLKDVLIVIEKNKSKGTIKILTTYGVRYFFGLDLWDIDMELAG